MAAPLLAIGKLLLKQTAKSALKKKAIGAAKNFAKKKAKEKLKDRAKSFLSRKKKKKGGALVKSERGALSRSVSSPASIIKPSTSSGPKSSALVKSGGSTSFAKVNSTLDNLVNTSEAIKEALARQYANDLAQSKEDRKEAEKERKRNREAILEAGKKGAGLVSGTLGAVGGKFSIMDFIKNVLLGGLLLFLLKNLDKIIKAFTMIKDNAYLFFRGLSFVFKGFTGVIRLGLGALKGLVKLSFAGPRLILKGIGKILKGVGKLMGAGLKKLGKAIFDFGKNAFKYIFNAAKNGAKIALQNLGKLAGAGAKGGIKAFQMMLQKGKNFITGKVFDARLAGRTLAKSPAGKAVRGTFGFLGRAGKKLVQGAGPLFKNLAKVAKGIRIPIIGPIIVAVASLMSGDPPTKTLFKAVGTGLGEALGSLIPIPIVGTLLGGLIGEYGGELFYDLFKGKPITGVAKRIRDDFLGGFNKVKDYFSGVWNRMWEKKWEFGKLLNPFGNPIEKFKKAFDLLKYVVFPPTDVTASGNVLMDKGTGVDNTQTEEVPEQEPQSTPQGTVPQGEMSGTESQQGAFNKIYQIAKKVGGAKFPEIVAAQAMHETGYLVNPNSVFFATNKTNAFGQTITASEVGSNGIVDKLWYRNRWWAVYDSLESSVKHNIKLWHDANRHKGNYNNFNTPLEGIASVAPAYSPNADPANIALGFTVDAYSKGMVKALKVGGFDPKGKVGQAPTITTAPASVAEQQVTTTTAIKKGDAILTNKVAFSDFSRTAAEGGGGSIGKTDDFMARGGRHKGIDIGTGGAKGYGVSLKVNGKVSYIGEPNGKGIGAGKTLMIKDANDPSKEYVFMHLARYMLKMGDNYSAGQVIGEIGNTGTPGGATDIHLHFEVRVNNKHIDPNPYLKLLEIGKISKAQNNTVAEFTTTRRSAPGASPSASGRDSETQPGSSTPSAATVTRDMGGSHGGGVNSYASYETASGEEVIYIPLPAPSKTQPIPMGGGRSMFAGASTKDVLNSYHKARLKAFLYKQG